MPDPVSATGCPHCGKELKVPKEYFGKVLRCKGCHTTFVAGPDQTSKAVVEQPKVEPAQAAKAGKKATPDTHPRKAVEPKQAPAEELPVLEPISTPSPYVKQWARRQRTGMIFFLFMVLVACGGIGVGVYVFWDQLVVAVNQIGKPAATKPQPTDPQDKAPLLGKDEVIDERPGDVTKLPTSEPGKRTKKSHARIPGPYPGRALLIGVRNYLYLNPLNPGYRVDRSFKRDPLGLISLQRTLVTELSFPREQTAILSDVADDKPVQPTKATIEATVDEFLKTTRASDRIVMTIVCHAAVLGDQAYLLPIDAELPPEGAKPDAERDAKLVKKMVAVKWLYEKLAACPARQKLLILDVAQEDPEADHLRTKPGPMDEKLHDQLKAAPKDTQVWLPCGVKQHSYLYHSSDQAGSVFMDYLVHMAMLSADHNWKRIEKDPELKKGTLPLVLLAKHLGKETTEYVKKRDQLTQVPELIGFEGSFTGAPPSDPPPPVTLKTVMPSGELVAREQVNLILKELGIENDPTRSLPASSFPPMLKSEFTKYVPDYQNTGEMEGKAQELPLRAVTLKAIKALNKAEKSFKMRFVHNPDEANFKKMVEREQEVPAYVTAELSDILEEMKGMTDKRDDEPSKRWQAHFDYTQMRVLAKLANVQEYGFVLGNKLRKDTPKLTDAARHNGWLIVPQRKLEQKETRSYDAERQKLAGQIIKDYPGTPWEVLARREQTTILGLTLQEAFLEEGQPTANSRRR